jgi:hypothetical protein
MKTSWKPYTILYKLLSRLAVHLRTGVLVTDYIVSVFLKVTVLFYCFFICCTFNDVFSALDYIALSGRIVSE